MTDRGPARLRRLNAARVLDALRTPDSPLTLTALSTRASVSRASMESLAAELVDLDLIASAASARGAPGRPAREYSLSPTAGAVVGIDIGAHGTTALASGLDLRVRGRAHVSSGPTLPPGERIAGAIRAAEAALQQAGLSSARVHRIHVGTAGIVDSEGVIRRSGALEGWSGAPVAEALVASYPAAGVRIDNDIRLSAIAEQRDGVAAGLDDVIQVHLGARTGAAIIIGGRAHIGRGGAAAEIGFLPAPSMEATPGPAGPAPAAVAALLAAAERGDPEARSRIDAYADAVVERIHPLIVAVAPQMVVLGGGLTRARDVVLLPLATRLSEALPDEIPIETARHGDDGVAYGALQDAAAALPSVELLDRARARGR
jgi:predicted NBD/HSP70 family sugar kinase